MYIGDTTPPVQACRFYGTKHDRVAMYFMWVAVVPIGMTLLPPVQVCRFCGTKHGRVAATYFCVGGGTRT